MKVINLYMPEGGERAVIVAWYAKDLDWIEFRGTPYSQWDEETDHPMQQLHDAMAGWHTTVLHQDSVLTLMLHHPDYVVVRDLMTF